MPQIRQISFNSLQDCFAVATDVGIRVYNARPLVELVNLKAELMGSVKIVALLDRSNMLAMVSGEPRPKFSNKTVMIWDNMKQQFSAELTVSSPVLNVAVSATRLVIVQHHHVHIFNMGTFEMVRHEESGPNPTGLVALSPNPKNEFLIFPSFKPGSVQVVNLYNVSQTRSIAPTTIFAHESQITKLAIDNQASKIATGSIKGTVIRIFDTQTKAKIFELRRGTQTAQLFCFRFSPDSAYFACCSDQGTIHVFSVTHTNDEKMSNTKRIIDHMRFAKDERRSMVQFTMPKPEQVAECAFLAEDVSKSELDMIAVTKDGYYYNFSKWNSKPQGFELIFNLAYDQEFWQI